MTCSPINLQGASHATNPDDSKVPHKVQELAPKGLEQSLPDSVHPTKGENSFGMGESHATGKSVVPEGLQKAVPEGLERALPDSVSCSGRALLFVPNVPLQIHDTSVGGKHTAEKEVKRNF
jgi:hypothetical protein